VSDATSAPRYSDLMHVLVRASTRQLRRSGNPSLACKLTWGQILEDLRRSHARLGLNGAYPNSRRSLARWLAALERDRFIWRSTETRRDRRGRILLRLTTFRFGVAGILWIKSYSSNDAAPLGRAIVPKLALRSYFSEKQKQRAVDKTIHSAHHGGRLRPPQSRPPRKRGG
jgi:hypothetical protein